MAGCCICTYVVYMERRQHKAACAYGCTVIPHNTQHVQRLPSQSDPVILY